MKSFSVISLVAIIALAGESYAQYKPSSSYKASAGGSYKAPTVGSPMPTAPIPAVDYPAPQMPSTDYSGSFDVSGEASAGSYDGSASSSVDVAPKVSAPVKGKPISGRPIPIRGGPIKFPGSVGGPIKVGGAPVRGGVVGSGSGRGSVGAGKTGYGSSGSGIVGAGLGGSTDGANGGGSASGSIDGPLGGGSIDGSVVGSDYPGLDSTGPTFGSGIPYEGPVSVDGPIDYEPSVTIPVKSQPISSRPFPIRGGPGKVPVSVTFPKRGGNVGRGSGKPGYTGNVDAGIGGSVDGTNGGGSVGGSLDGSMGSGDYPGSQMSGTDYSGTDVSGEATTDILNGADMSIPDYTPEVTAPIPVKTKPITKNPRPIRGNPVGRPGRVGITLPNPVRGGRGSVGQPGRGSGSGSGSVDIGPINGSGSVGGANGSGSANGSIDGPLGNGSIGGSINGEDYITPAPVDAYPGNAVSGCGGAPAPIVDATVDYVPDVQVACPLTSKPSYPTKIEEPYVAKAPVKEYIKSNYTKPAKKY